MIKKFLKSFYISNFKANQLKKHKKQEIFRILCELTGKNITETTGKIYVLGDSHTNFWSGSEQVLFIRFKNGIEKGLDLIPFFETYHLGPALAFNLNNPHSKTRASQKIDFLIKTGYIPEKSTIMMCFGEIDCRAHILKQADIQNKKPEIIVHETVFNYIEYSKALQAKGFKIICWGATATLKDNTTQHPEFPRCKDEITRNEITRIFNEHLEKQCLDNNIVYCSIFNDLVDSNNQTIAKYYSQDKCHLSQNALKLAIQELLNKKALTVNKNTLKAGLN